MRLLRYLLFACALGQLLACSEPIQPQLKVVVGKTFPNLQLRDLKNQPYLLNAATGKLLVLNFWATWCPPCRQEMPSLDRLSTLVDPERVSIIGISVDNDDHLVREFLIERKIFFQNLLDPSMQQTAALVGVRAFPSTFYIAPDGTLLKLDEGWKLWDTPEVIREINGLLEKTTEKPVPKS